MNSRAKFENNCVCGTVKFISFNKYSHLLGTDVPYKQCKSCGSVTAVEARNYDLSKFYNDNYFSNIDYGWQDRSKLVLKFINVLNISLNLKKLLICDYGAGNGYLTKSLIDNGYKVLAYEPYLGKELYLDKKYFRLDSFKADILLMIEVFEHFFNASKEIKEILLKFNYPRLIIFTTLLVENSKRNGTDIIDWWYLNPDAGHFTLWSEKGLKSLGISEGYRIISFSDFFHIFVKKEFYKEYILLKIQSSVYNIYLSYIKKIIKK